MGRPSFLVCSSCGTEGTSGRDLLGEGMGDWEQKLTYRRIDGWFWNSLSPK